MERAFFPTYENSTLSNRISTGSREYNSQSSLILKRTFDLTLAITSALILSPIILALCLVVLITNGRPVIFKQERIGRGGKPFTLYKFRTMRNDAEADGQARLCKEEDSRLTKFGAFLRSHHLDELPQLLNVIRGDMSFVGHRPERKVFIDRIMELNPDYTRLYALRPGLFSTATLYNGYTDTIEKMMRRLQMDLDYLANRSLALDCKIIFLTAYFIISGKKF